MSSRIWKKLSLNDAVRLLERKCRRKRREDENKSHIGKDGRTFRVHFVGLGFQFSVAVILQAARNEHRVRCFRLAFLPATID